MYIQLILQIFGRGGADKQFDLCLCTYNIQKRIVQTLTYEN